MNYDEPRERQKDGRWHYTSMNDGQVRAIGYCGERGSDCHDEAHETREEAVVCYGRYLLDERARYSDGPDDPDELHRCEAPGCTEMTAGSARILLVGGGPLWWLCDEHRKRETVETLFSPPASSVHS